MGTTVRSRAHRAGAQLRWPSPCHVRVPTSPAAAFTIRAPPPARASPAARPHPTGQILTRVPAQERACAPPHQPPAGRPPLGQVSVTCPVSAPGPGNSRRLARILTRLPPQTRASPGGRPTHRPRPEPPPAPGTSTHVTCPVGAPGPGKLRRLARILTRVPPQERAWAPPHQPPAGAAHPPGQVSVTWPISAPGQANLRRLARILSRPRVGARSAEVGSREGRRRSARPHARRSSARAHSRGHRPRTAARLRPRLVPPCAGRRPRQSASILALSRSKSGKTSR